jgi:hypothetical protein
MVYVYGHPVTVILSYLISTMTGISTSAEIYTSVQFGSHMVIYCGCVAENHDQQKPLATSWPEGGGGGRLKLS